MNAFSQGVDRSVGDAGRRSAIGKSQLPKALRFVNGEFHDWYRIVLGFPDHLVSGLVEEFGLGGGQSVLDPFCGTGTTLVECMKRGVDSVGVDANPSSYFAAKIKTTWDLDKRRLVSLLEETRRIYARQINAKDTYTRDPTYEYIVASGMLERGWISPVPLRKVIVLKNSILATNATKRYKGPLLLALMSEVVQGASNVKFGPELYCVRPKSDADVLEGFEARVREMAEDLSRIRDLKYGSARVLLGDSRERKTLMAASREQFDAVICSPPYPTEHDYTRNSRLELAFLEAVVNRPSLRAIKRQMIRSHTKGIYTGDDDDALVSRLTGIQVLAEEIEDRARSKEHGFAKLYGTVVRHYFGGMRRHFRSVKPRLKRRAVCAYVVGDQSSYLQVHIPTGKILGRIAELEGFDVVDIRHWRGRWGSATSKSVDEHVLIVRKN